MDSKWSGAQCSPFQEKSFTRIVDDDQSTAVPSDVLDGTVSDLSTWDTGNIEDLSSCGVLTSAELRAARMQKLARAKGSTQAGAASSTPAKSAAKAKCMPSSSSSSSGGYTQSSADMRTAHLSQSLRPHGPPVRLSNVAASQGSKSLDRHIDDDDRSTAAPSDVTEPSISPEEMCMTSAELRRARLQSAAKATPKRSTAPKAPLPTPTVAAAKPKATIVSTNKTSHVAVQMQSELDKSSREAIREMGLWEYMPARNPVVTRDTCKGADWHIGFEDYQHTLGGVPDAKPVERPHKADELRLRLDIQSREAIKEMGLWEHMPARNPVVTRETRKGADWHIGFEDYQHSLGGVPDAKPVERSHKADELNRRLDINSREAIKEMGLWEHMPARNPVVTKETKKGADWHIGFGEYVHTLGGVPHP